MKKGRFTEEQIIGVLKQHEAGRKVPELAARDRRERGDDLHLEVKGIYHQSEDSEDSFSAPLKRPPHCLFAQSNQEILVSKELRLSDLSPPRQALVRLCQAINHGSIEDLEFKHSVPVFDPWPVTLRDVKLYADEDSRPELSLGDFVVSDEIVRLLKRLDETKCGTLRRIEVHAGVPRRMLVESQVTARPHQPGRSK